jgi:hypothetical protein
MNLICLSSSAEEVDFCDGGAKRRRWGKKAFSFSVVLFWFDSPPPSPNSSRFGATSSAEEDKYPTLIEELDLEEWKLHHNLSYVDYEIYILLIGGGGFL